MYSACNTYDLADSLSRFDSEWAHIVGSIDDEAVVFKVVQGPRSWCGRRRVVKEFHGYIAPRRYGVWPFRVAQLTVEEAFSEAVRALEQFSDIKRALTERVHNNLVHAKQVVEAERQG